MPPHPHTRIPLQPHPNIPQHPYPRMPQQPICSCPYYTSTSIYAPYGVTNNPHIPYLGYLHQPAPIILPSSILPNLFPPDACPHSSPRMN